MNERTDANPAVCVLFDLDGTLVDSERLGHRAFLDLVPELDDTVPGMVARYRGMRFRDIAANLARRAGRVLPDDFEARFRAHSAELFRTRLEPTPGTPEMLAALPPVYARAIASNGPKAKMELVLRVTGLAARFDPGSLFSAYDIQAWKPDPALFLHAAGAMGFAPDRCVVVEDSPVGLAAARAAGMRAVFYDPHGEGLDETGRETAIGDMRELPAALSRLGF